MPAYTVVLAYDLIAFGSQVLLGWLTDRFATPKRAVLFGLALTALSLMLYRTNVVATVAAAGIGNALFHLGAGAAVLRGTLERAAPSGVFVAPGALGLALGIAYGALPFRGPVWPLLGLVLTALVAVSLRRGDEASPCIDAELASPLTTRHGTAKLAIVLLLFSIAVRSLVGMSAARGYARTDLLMIGLPISAFVGKSLGGYLADRLGWTETSVAALLLCMPLITLAPPTWCLLMGLLALQMTMPVTLTAIARALPQRLATAFGWACLALIIGALPTMLPQWLWLGSRPLLVLWIVLAAASLYAGLRLIGTPNHSAAASHHAASIAWE